MIQSLVHFLWYLLSFNVARIWGFLGGLVVKDSHAKLGDGGWITGLGKSPGEGNGNPLQYTCLENSIDRGEGGYKESDTTEHTRTYTQVS